MTTRAAAMAGMAYFADIRDIAARVGVDVPSDADIAARFAATDAIDIPALSADSSMLADVVGGVTGAADAAVDAHGVMPDAWRGRSADAADAAITAHVRHSRDVVDGVRVVASTVAAAASALTRVQDEKHRTLAMLRTDRVAGHAISTITAETTDADAVAIARDISAAVDLFTRTMTTVDAAVSAILDALTDSFARLPTPRATGFETTPSGPVSRPTRSPRRRTDVVAMPPVSCVDHGVPQADAGVVAAAISATATISGAALAAASAVGMAAVDGVGSVLTHLIDAVADDHDHNRSDDRAGRDDRAGGDVRGGGVDHHVPEVARPVPPIVHHPTPMTAPVDEHAATADRDRVQRTPQAVAVPDAPAAPGTHPHRSPAPVPAVPADAAPERENDRDARSQGVDVHTAPSVGSRARAGDAPPRGRPDPDDAGGLALAGDR